MCRKINQETKIFNAVEEEHLCKQWLSTLTRSIALSNCDIQWKKHYTEYEIKKQGI